MQQTPQFRHAFVFKGEHNHSTKKQSYSIPPEQFGQFPLHAGEHITFFVDETGLSFNWLYRHTVSSRDIETTETMVAYIHRNLTKANYLGDLPFRGSVSRLGVQLENIDTINPIDRVDYDNRVLLAIAEAWEVKPSHVFLYYEQPMFLQHRFLAEPVFSM